MKLNSGKQIAAIFLLITLSFSLYGCGILELIWPDLQESSRPITEEEARSILDIQTTAAEKYWELRNQDRPDALERTVSWLNDQEDVKQSAVTPRGNIYIQYECGLESFILTHDPAIPGVQIGAPLNLQDGTVSSSENHQTGGLIPLAAIPGDKTAILLFPFHDPFVGEEASHNFREESYEYLPAILNNLGYETRRYKNSEVTIDLMKTLNQYGIIFISTHGGKGLLTNNIYIATGQKINPRILNLDWNQLRLKIGVITPPDSTESYFAINNWFIDDFSYPNSLVIINACDSFKTSSLADAFLNSGAAVYFGWDDTSNVFFNEQATKMLFNLLKEPDATIYEAYTTPLQLGLLFPYLEGWNYSIKQLFNPATAYKDSDRDGEYRLCYGDYKCIGDRDDTVVDHEVRFKYEKRHPGEDFSINPQQEGIVGLEITFNPNPASFNTALEYGLGWLFKITIKNNRDVGVILEGIEIKNYDTAGKLRDTGTDGKPFFLHFFDTDRIPARSSISAHLVQSPPGYPSLKKTWALGTTKWTIYGTDDNGDQFKSSATLYHTQNVTQGMAIDFNPIPASYGTSPRKGWNYTIIIKDLTGVGVDITGVSFWYMDAPGRLFPYKSTIQEDRFFKDIFGTDQVPANGKITASIFQEPHTIPIYETLWIIVGLDYQGNEVYGAAKIPLEQEGQFREEKAF